MKKIFTIVILALFGLYACEKPKSKAKTETPTADTVFKASMAGTVTQYNQYSTNYTVGLNTAIVNISGINASTVTNASGNYTINDVPAGTYTVTFNKFGCGEWQTQRVIFSGKSTQFVSGFAVEKPTYLFTGAIISDSLLFGVHKIYAKVSMVPVSEISGVLIISGGSPNLDITNLSSFSKLYTGSIPANASSYSFYQGVGVSGTTYYRIYPYPSVSSARSYYDYASGQQIYTAYGDSGPATYSIAVP